MTPLEISHLISEDINENMEVPKTPREAYRYALRIIKGRWPEAELIILTDPRWAYYYTLNIIKGRWPEFEEKYFPKQITLPDDAPLTDNDEFGDDEEWVEKYKRGFGL